jgi:hypothetical protein
VEGSCEHGNEFSGSIKCEKSVNRLRDCDVLKKDSILWSEGFQLSSGHTDLRK